MRTIRLFNAAEDHRHGNLVRNQFPAINIGFGFYPQRRFFVKSFTEHIATSHVAYTQRTCQLFCLRPLPRTLCADQDNIHVFLSPLEVR